MTVLLALLVVAVVVAVAMWAISTLAGARSEPDESPDRRQVTSDAVIPPPDPSRPIPGSQPDRERKGRGGEQIGSPIVRRRSR